MIDNRLKKDLRDKTARRFIQTVSTERLTNLIYLLEEYDEQLYIEEHGFNFYLSPADLPIMNNRLYGLQKDVK